MNDLIQKKVILSLDSHKKPERLCKCRVGGLVKEVSSLTLAFCCQ